MDLLLNDKQKELVQLVRDLANQEIEPYVRNRDFSGNLSFDWYLVGVLGEHNLMCPTVPIEYGGLGLDMFTTALIIEEISSACKGLSTIISANIHAVQPILLAGNDKMKETYLPRFTGKNACLASFALTEPNSGSDINSMNTIARKFSDVYIINGNKDYIINAPEAEIITLFAFCDTSNKKASMRCFIIPKDTPGMIIDSGNNMAVSNYAKIASIVFDNARVNADLVLKEEEPYSGYLLINQTLDIGRVLVGASSVGIARKAYDLAFKFAKERSQYGCKTISEHQVIAHALVDMATKIEMARLMTWKAAWMVDRGEDYTITSAMAKLSSSIIAQEVTGIAADILAARAFEKGSLMKQLLIDAKAQSTVEGTNNIQRNVIATFLLNE